MVGQKINNWIETKVAPEFLTRKKYHDWCLRKTVSGNNLPLSTEWRRIRHKGPTVSMCWYDQFHIKSWGDRINGPECFCSSLDFSVLLFLLSSLTAYIFCLFVCLFFTSFHLYFGMLSGASHLNFLGIRFFNSNVLRRYNPDDHRGYLANLEFCEIA